MQIKQEEVMADMNNYTIGIDIGGTNLRVALIDKTGEIIKDRELPTEAELGPEHGLKKMVSMIEELKDDYEIIGIGVGSPGPLDPYKGLILDPPNLPGWENYQLVHNLEKETGLSVTLDNDANAAALAEAVCGAGQAYSSVTYITISTGIGAGIVLDGKVLLGAHGIAGEVGNMILTKEGPVRDNLNQGAWETLASGTAIAREGKERLGVDGGAEEVFRLAQEGNIEAGKIVDEIVTYWAKGIANLVHIINPDIFVLGGGVMKSEQSFFQQLLSKIDDYVYSSMKGKTVIKHAQLGTKAGVIGAGLLPRHT
jgi:glucokinase